MPKPYRQIVFGDKSYPMAGADYYRSGMYERESAGPEQCWNLWFEGATRGRYGFDKLVAYADGAIHNGGAADTARWHQVGSCLYAERKQEA